MDEHHWLPKDIGKISYKKLQKMFIIKKQKNETAQTQANVEKFKSQHSSSRGQSRRFTREV